MTSAVRTARPLPRAVPAPAPTRRPDLHVVGDRPRRARTGLVVGLATLVVFGALLAGAVAHSLLVSGQVHLDETGEQVRTERDLLRTEQLELATLESPARIVAEAEARGMVPSDTQTWVSPDAADGPVVTGGPATDPAADAQDDTDDGTADASELAAGAPGGAELP